MNYRINDQVVWIESDDEIRLYSSITGEFLSLSGTAAEIWKLVARELSFEAITSALVEKYNEGNASEAIRVERDTSGFLDSLVGQRLIEKAAEGAVREDA